jgi:hypothetical protein
MKTYRFAPLLVIHYAIPPTIKAPKQLFDIHRISVDIEGMELLLKRSE